VRGRQRGRKVGSGVGLKRKVEEDYSTNVNTKRVRNRLLNMNEPEAELQRAKEADRKAGDRYVKEMEKKTDGFFTWPEGQKREQRQQWRQELLQKR
jgi:hypothetical protein